MENKDIQNNGKDSKQYFAIHTETGKEDSLVNILKENISKEFLQDCFVIKRERIKKFRGNWELLTENIFPEYVFVNTNSSERLEAEINRLLESKTWKKSENADGVKIIIENDYLLIPVSVSETDFIHKVENEKNDYTIHLSKLFMSREDDSILSIDGDLEKFRDRIKKIDKRNRHAVVETYMFGKSKELYVGFEFGSE